MVKMGAFSLLKTKRHWKQKNYKGWISQVGHLRIIFLEFWFINDGKSLFYFVLLKLMLHFIII
jgi:hypothetical protein